MDDVTIPLPSIDLDTKEQLFVLVVATIAGFAAEKLTAKGLTKVIKLRK